MKILLVRTFSRMFKPLPLIIVSILSTLLGLLFSHIYRLMATRILTYERLLNNVVIIFSLFVFVILFGLLIWFIAANYTTGLFASEIHEGTMRLLLAKKISRNELVIGKISGIFLGSVAYLIFILAWFLLMLALFGGVDRDILILLLKVSGILLGYGVVVIFILGGFASFLSAIFKKKVPAILIMIGLASLIFGIIPIIRFVLINLGYYNQLPFYLIDLNYHFGLIFHNFLRLAGDFTTSQDTDMLFTLFTNLYHQVGLDIDIVLNNNSMTVLNNTLNSLTVMITYLVVALGSYLLTFRIMNKKDI